VVTFNVTISDAEAKVLRTDLCDDAGIQAWLQNLLKTKAARFMDMAILANTDGRPDLMSPAEKEAVVDKLTLAARER
jgi:hypothetical protein